ncbi:MAG TPA: type II toxin-antitoxin system PemK/MazF family toxin [Stellaceae bacterium]|nr:type II toxin-antitoxin system PemK/MazF family toxin [Stellaceae bacterium]
MRRGEIWTVAGGSNYAGKPRPAVIVQNDRFDALESITICGFTTDPTEAPIFRILVEPSGDNGLRAPARLMVDKIATVPKTKIGTRVGILAPDDLVRLNRAIVRFLDLSGALI